jgi:hypothetical protein
VQYHRFIYGRTEARVLARIPAILTDVFLVFFSFPSRDNISDKPRVVSFQFIVHQSRHSAVYDSEVLTASLETPWLWSASELYQPSDRRLLPKLVTTFADRGCRVVSSTDSHGR